MNNKRRVVAAAVSCGILCVALCMSSLAAQTVSPDGFGISAEVPDDFIVLTEDTLHAHEELLSRLGQTPEQMAVAFQSEGIVFRALSADGKNEISLTRSQNAVSQSIGNLSDLAVSQREQVQKQIMPSAVERAHSLLEIAQNDILYFKAVLYEQDNSLPAASSIPGDPMESADSDLSAPPSEDEWNDASFSTILNLPLPDESEMAGDTGEAPASSAAVFYITIVDGQFYTLSLFDYSGSLSENVENQFDLVFQSLRFAANANEQTLIQNRVNRAVNRVLIVAAAVVVVATTISIIRELQRRRLDSNWQKKSPKKPLR